MIFWIFIITVVVVWIIFSNKKKSSSTIVTNPRVIRPQWSTSQNKTHSSHFSGDSELSTLILLIGKKNEIQSRRCPSKHNTLPKTTLARWVFPGETVTVGNVIIRRGNFYLREQATNSHNAFTAEGSEASLVNEALLIQTASLCYEDESLGYWPKYSTLSPECRGAYLDWLASDRADRSCPIGYVFIYFYGLESRILVDSEMNGKRISDTEFSFLFDEVLRLKKIYHKNDSFNRYSGQLIETMSILRPDVVQIKNENEYFASGCSILFRFRLATTVAKGKPVSADLALAWVKYYTEYSPRTPARRCADEFSTLFNKYYTEKFGDGLIVKPNKTPLRLHYTPASGSLKDINIPLGSLPDPGALRAPVQKLIQIAEICTGELDAYSRYLGKKRTSADDISAILLLPNKLLTEDSLRMFASFKCWADEIIRVNSGLVLVTDFWSRMNMPVPDKITKKDAELMSNYAQRGGYGIAPDMRYHNAKLETEGYVVLFPEGYGESIPSSAFFSLSIALHLGVMVAKNDNMVGLSEQSALEKMIDLNNTLNVVEKRSLHAYLTWLLNVPITMVGLKKRIEALKFSEKNSIGNEIIRVACADGKIELAEIKQLEKIYASLGLDSHSVSGDIHRFSFMEKSKTPNFNTRIQDNSGFSLDEHILARHESDTTDVRQLLNTIFMDNESDESATGSLPSHAINKLDDIHHQLYQCLLAKERWSRNEVSEFCRQLNLMMSGAIETINEWSYEQIDAPVLDDNDDIYVDMEVAQELKG